jgi:hypothetical protein
MISLLATFSIPPDMRCSFNGGIYNEANDWSMVSFQDVSPPYKKGHGGLKWSQTPTNASNLGILKNILRFDGRHVDHASLQIPSYWPVSFTAPYDSNGYAEHSSFRSSMVYHGNLEMNSLWHLPTLL